MSSRSNSRGRPSSRRTSDNPQAPAAAAAPVVLTHGQFMELLEAARRADAPQVNVADAGNNVPFALTPSLVNMTQPIDFSTSEGAKLNKTAVSALPFMFDVESGSINTFNEILMDRCITCGWNNGRADILTIPVDGENRNLIEDYGNISIDDIRIHCQGYVLNHTRQAQHQFQMYQCLMASLTDKGRLKIVSEVDKYTVNDIKCGPLLFKLLMSKAVIDSRATVSHIRENLASLDTYMIKVQSNITLFNDYVKDQITNLTARGEKSEDLLTNLWKAYFVVSDKNFVRYIQGKKDAYDEGEDIHRDSLMTLAENKYKALVVEGKWNSLSEEQNQIISLTAELKKLKENRLQLGNKGKKSDKNKERKSDKDKENQDPKPKGKKNSNERFKDKWAWKKVAPKSGESEVKNYNDTKYYWCKGHKLWCKTKHDANSCQLLKEALENSRSGPQSMQCIAETSQNSVDVTRAVSFMAKMQEMLQG